MKQLMKRRKKKGVRDGYDTFALLDMKIQGLEKDYKRLVFERDNLQSRGTNVQMREKIRSVREKLAAVTNEGKDLRNRLSHLTRELKELESKPIDSELTDEQKAKIERIQKEISALEKEKERLENDTETMKLVVQFRELNKQVSMQNQEVEAIKREIRRLKAECDKKREELEKKFKIVLSDKKIYSTTDDLEETIVHDTYRYLKTVNGKLLEVKKMFLNSTKLRDYDVIEKIKRKIGKIEEKIRGEKLKFEYLINTRGNVYNFTFDQSSSEASSTASRPRLKREVTLGSRTDLYSEEGEADKTKIRMSKSGLVNSSGINPVKSKDSSSVFDGQVIEVLSSGDASFSEIPTSSASTSSSRPSATGNEGGDDTTSTTDDSVNSSDTSSSETESESDETSSDSEDEEGEGEDGTHEDLKKKNDIPNIETLLSIPLAVDYFTEFLRFQFNEENILFFLAVRDFKHNFSDQNKAKKARQIFDTYISTSGKYEINIHSKTRDAIYEKIQAKEFTVDMFDEAQESVYVLMNQNSFAPFKQSSLYNELMEALEGSHNAVASNMKSAVLISRKTKSETLNSDFQFFGKPRNAVRVAEELLESLISILNVYYSVANKIIDLNKVANSVLFRRFVTNTSELQRVSISDLDETDKLCFFLNIYNTLFLHACISKSIPLDEKNWLKFRRQNKYSIGGRVFSLATIMDRVLRGPRAEMKEGQKMHSYYISKFDNRIHFGVISLFRRVSYLRVYYRDTVHSSLKEVTLKYLDANVEIEGSKVILDDLFSRHASDFEKKKREDENLNHDDIIEELVATSKDTILKKWLKKYIDLPENPEIEFKKREIYIPIFEFTTVPSLLYRLQNTNPGKDVKN